MNLKTFYTFKWSENVIVKNTVTLVAYHKDFYFIVQMRETHTYKTTVSAALIWGGKFVKQLNRLNKLGKWNELDLYRSTKMNLTKRIQL